ncbi:hypothetical protein [Candidatus Pantoea persica]
MHDFHIGDLATDSNADLIDLSELLDYTGSLSFYQDGGGSCSWTTPPETS